MKVVQSLNQNALLVVDDHNEELVALGKGIGFGKKKGDLIDPDTVTRVFTVQSSEQQKRILDTLKDIDSQVYLMAEEVVSLSEKELGKKLNPTFVFTIAKHISFALERQKEERVEYDPFQFQLKYLYPDEYRTALIVIEKLNEKYHVNLKKQEVSFFTLHLVNGLIDSEDFNDILKLSDILNHIVSFVDQHCQEPLEKDSIHYSRFIVHLRYFLIRSLSKEGSHYQDDKMEELFQLTKDMYPQESKLLDDLKDMLAQKYKLTFGIEEDLYLLLHLVRIFRREPKR